MAWADKINSIDVLGEEQSLVALYKCSYTPPAASMVSYDLTYTQVSMKKKHTMRHELIEFT
jgi:hypothetical protein